MRCSEARITAFYYLDGQLDDTEKSKLEKHVIKCKTCRDRLELMENIPADIDATRHVRPQANFTTIVMQRVTIVITDRPE